jgi:hypothetical protein
MDALSYAEHAAWAEERFAELASVQGRLLPADIEAPELLQGLREASGEVLEAAVLAHVLLRKRSQCESVSRSQFVRATAVLRGLPPLPDGEVAADVEGGVAYALLCGDDGIVQPEQYAPAADLALAKFQLSDPSGANLSTFVKFWIDCAHPHRQGTTARCARTSPRKKRSASWSLLRPKWDARHNVSAVKNEDCPKHSRMYFDPPSLSHLPGTLRRTTGHWSTPAKNRRRRQSLPEASLKPPGEENYSARSLKLSARDAPRDKINSARGGMDPLQSVRFVRSRTTAYSVARSVGGKSAMERMDEVVWGADRHRPGGVVKNPFTGAFETWNNDWSLQASASNEFAPAILRSYFPDPAMPPHFRRHKIPN